jgi:hypothetical protein
MMGEWSLAMLADGEPFRGLRLPNTLAAPERHTALVIGHLLRRLYADILQDDHPERLKTLIAKLDRTVAPAGSRPRSSEVGQ